MSQIATAPVKREREGAATSRPLRIGILGHVGNQNLGDESIIAAVLQNLRRRWPDAEIFGFTADPTDTEERHGIPTYSIHRDGRSQGPSASSGEDSGPQGRGVLGRVKDLLRRVPILFSALRSLAGVPAQLAEIGKELIFLRDCRRSIKGLDLLIFAGSHQLNDYVGGPWVFPYNVFKWSLLARATGAKTVFLSLGAGPIETWLGRRFIRSSLKMASYRSYRDETAKQVIDSLYPLEKGKVVPDLAFSLDLPAVTSPATRRARPVVGINPLPLYAPYWHESDPQKYESYVGKIAGFADWLVDRGCEVRFIPTQLRADPPVIKDVIKTMSGVGVADQGSLVLEPSIDSLSDLLAELSELDFMVATRYHGIVLSLALRKPVLAIAYHHKSRDVMHWLGLGEYVVEGDTFDVSALTERFPLLERAGPSITDSLTRQMPEFQSAVQAQYDVVARIMEGMLGASSGGEVARPSA